MRYLVLIGLLSGCYPAGWDTAPQSDRWIRLNLVDSVTFEAVGTGYDIRVSPPFGLLIVFAGWVRYTDDEYLCRNGYDPDSRVGCCAVESVYPSARWARDLLE